MKIWRIDMGKCSHGCRLLRMASRKVVLTFLVFLFGFSWVSVLILRNVIVARLHSGRA